MVGSVSIIDGQEVVAELTLNSSETHATRLMPAIDYLLKGSNLTLNAIDLIGVGTGPGSFTSLRIGISTAKSLAHVLKKPIVGVPTLDGLAGQLSLSNVTLCPLLDAYGGEIYWALYRSISLTEAQRFTPYRLTSVEGLVSQINDTVIFCGEGLKPYGQIIKEKLSNLAYLAPPTFWLPRASFVAALATIKFGRGEGDERHCLGDLLSAEGHCLASSR